jgi:hypothetical protein
VPVEGRPDHSTSALGHELEEAGMAPGGSATVAREHLVVFYEDDPFLADCVSAFARRGLGAQGRVLIVATPPHRRAVLARLRHLAPRAAVDAAVTLLDARATLDGLLVDDAVDADRLTDRVVPWLTTGRSQGHDLRIYGEMVALLWKEGRFEEALRLEELWNRLAERFSFRLLCGYPMRGFGMDTDTTGFVDVCREHTAVTTEGYPHSPQAAAMGRRGRCRRSSWTIDCPAARSASAGMDRPTVGETDASDARDTEAHRREVPSGPCAPDLRRARCLVSTIRPTPALGDRRP